MTAISRLAEQKFRRRTIDLVEQFNAAIAEQQSSRDSHQRAKYIDGVVRNAVRLLREHKTNVVRHEAAERSADQSVDYDALKSEIDKVIEGVLAHRKYRVPERSSTRSTGTIDLTDRLCRLAELRKSGALTDKEFAAAKAKLL